MATQERWTGLQAKNLFDPTRAESSLLALPENLSRIKPAKIEQAMSDVFPTVATVRKYHGEEQAGGTVAEIIAQAAALINAGKNLQPHQIEFLADEILQNWYWLTIAEIRFFMIEGIRGKYGAIYDRIDVNTVLEWLEQYNSQRMATVEMKSFDPDKVDLGSEKPSETATHMPEKMREMLKGLENKYLVDGVARTGIKSGEFEPDDATIEMIRQEWEAHENPFGESFESYKVVRIAQIKAQMKK